MKWSLSTLQKVKIAGLLFGVMAVIVCSSLNIMQSLDTVDDTLNSVYADRLQPAVDFLDISETLHAKREVLDDYLTGRTTLSSAALRLELNRYHANSQRLISQFAKTRLVKGEGEQLQAFRANQTQYRRLEDQVLALHESGQAARAAILFREPGGALFQSGMKSLQALAHIQSHTGQEAVHQAHREVAGGSLNATLLIAVAICIGLMIHSIFAHAQLIPRDGPPFHLN
ncbi:MAG TPA: MCP four helix bundle domain-containing protein [Fibrella sp.]